MNTKQEITIGEKIRLSKRTIEMYQNKIEEEKDNLNKLYVLAGYEQIRCYYKDCDTSFFINPLASDNLSFYKCPKCKELLDPNEYKDIIPPF